MGMRDQSWCASCGAGMLYTEDENVTCYKCDQEEYNKIETKSSKFMEYMKIHLINLNQDYDKFYDEYLNTREYDISKIDDIKGQIVATEHLLSVATDIMNASNERYINE
jgi:hypothetical protein